MSIVKDIEIQYKDVYNFVMDTYSNNHGALAQLGERRAGSAKVTGSSPVCSIQKALILCRSEGLRLFLLNLL
jgi:hypothetical protein